MQDVDGRRLRLAPVPSAEKLRLRRLFDDYLVEFAALEGITVQRDSEGHMPYPYFDAYWHEPGRIPFALCLDEEMIGFCLLRDTGTHWQITEFYVVPVHRGMGAGTRAVFLAKEYCRSDGRYRCLGARTQTFNSVARAFWKSQGFITTSDTGGEQENLFDLFAPSRTQAPCN